MVFAALVLEPGTARNVVVIASMGLMGPFAAMAQTVQQSATKKFTSTISRSAGFSLWYVFMNIGATVAGFLIDYMFQSLGLPRFHLVTFGIFTAVICLLITKFGIVNEEQVLTPAENAEKEAKLLAGIKEEEEPQQKPWAAIKEVAVSKIFWKFAALVAVLMGVRAVFLYLGLIFPKYWLRMIGEDAGVGWLQTVNPVLITVGLILLIPILNKFKLFNLLVVGALVSSISMFFNAIPAPAGTSVATWTYQTTVVFMLILTVGELMWSPRLQEYTAAIAPKDKEGIYLGLSMLPYFFAKLLVSWLSGSMLVRWCPEFPEGTPILGKRIEAGQVDFVDSPYMMFIILGGVALAGAIIAIILRKWFVAGMEEAKEQKARETA
jgi:hypothetical protein